LAGRQPSLDEVLILLKLKRSFKYEVVFPKFLDTFQVADQRFCMNSHGGTGAGSRQSSGWPWLRNVSTSHSSGKGGITKASPQRETEMLLVEDTLTLDGLINLPLSAYEFSIWSQNTLASNKRSVWTHSYRFISTNKLPIRS